jgi:cobalt-zinc-cadmium efflux system outer membrane protein
MTLDEVFQYALATNPILRARQSEVEIACARLVTAGLVTNPAFTMDTESPIDTGGRTDMTTRLVFTIPTAGKIRRRQAVAQEGIRRSQIALARQSELVLVEAADAAHQVLYLQQLLELHRQREEITAQRAETVPARLGTGQLNFVNKVEAEIDAVSARTQRLETSKDLALARSRLALAIGLDPSLSITMRGTLDVDPAPLLPLERWVDLARTNNPRLADASAAVFESESQHVLAWAESVPDIQLGPRYQDSLGVKDDRIGARFQVDVPVFDRNQGVILQSAAQVRANREMMGVALLNSLHDVVVAHAELQSIQEAARYYKTEVEAMIRRNEQLVEDPAVRDVIRDDEALEIRQDLLALELTYLQLRYRYNQLRAQLEVLLGAPITREKESVPPPRPISTAGTRPL